MGFSVDTEGLDSLGSLLQRGTDDATAIYNYFNDNCGISFTGEGLINLISDTDDLIEQNITSYLQTLSGTTLPDTTTAVSLAAQYYRSTDAKNAADLDQTLPDADVAAANSGLTDITTTDDSEPPPSFSDVGDPSASLTGLPDFNEEMPYEPLWYDIASPTSIARDAVWAVTSLASMLEICDRPYDIFELFLKPVVGDWAGMAATGYALKQIAYAGIDLDINIGWGAQCATEVWSGHAADNAVAHLDLIRKSLFAANASLLEIGQEYQDCAEAAYGLATAVGVILCDVADEAIGAAAAAAAEGVLTASGAGVPIALVIGAFVLTEVYETVKSCWAGIKLVADIECRMDAFESAVGSGDGKIDGTFDPPELPTISNLPS